MPLIDIEKKHCQGFLEFCKEKGLAVPDSYLSTDNMLVRYLQATKWDYQKSFDAVMLHHNWTIQTQPHICPNKTALDMLTKNGFMYFFKRDRFLRPIVVVNVAKIKNFTGDELEGLVPTVSYLMTYVIQKALIPGKAETMVTIIDLNGVSMTQIPVKALKKFLQSSQTNFRGRSYKTFILNANMLIRGSFGIIKAMIDEFSAQKLNMLGSDFKKQFLELIDPNNLEKRFGGNVPDKTSGFFPPDFSEANQTMMTKEEYFNKIGKPITNAQNHEKEQTFEENKRENSPEPKSNVVEQAPLVQDQTSLKAVESTPVKNEENVSSLENNKPTVDSAIQYIDTNASEDLSKTPTEMAKQEAVEVSNTVMEEAES